MVLGYRINLGSIRLKTCTKNRNVRIELSRLSLKARVLRLKQCTSQTETPFTIQRMKLHRHRLELRSARIELVGRSLKAGCSFLKVGK